MRPPKKTEYGDWATWVTFEVMSNYQVRLIISEDLLKSAKARLGSAPGEEADAFVYHVKGEGLSYIFVPLDAPEGTVVHECWHIVHRILTWCGVKDMDDEVVAYHLDHMVEKFYDFKRAVKSSMEVSDDQSDSRPKRKVASKRRVR